MREVYDVAVIGAGPAGLNAVYHLFRGNDRPSVLLVDKTVPWEHPKGCAEAVGRLGLEKAVDIKPSWVRYVVDKATFHAPNGASITYTDKNKGFIIDRVLMQQDMSERCGELGADVVFNTAVRGISTLMGSGRTIYFQNGASISSRVVIDASGAIAGLGKHEKVPWKPEDLEPSCFAVVKGVDIDTNIVHIYVGKRIAPAGYAWVFPREKNTVNIGILIGKQFRGKVNITTLLDAFLSDYFPKGKVRQRFAGCIPCQSGRRAMAVYGLLKAGDAASTINPISRAGIFQAMLSGGLAGDFALKMLGAQTSKDLKTMCAGYEKAWHETCGKIHCKLARVKTSLQKVPDEDYENAAKILSGIPEHELTMSTIFKMSLGRFPRLVWAIRHLM
ncbi:MAG: NAD(P)/FAD-dependent oxidoreductase [Chitinivibrionales bacterium]